MGKFKDIILNEMAASWAWDELQRYNLDAGKRLLPGMRKEFEEYLPSSTIKIYRGLGFNASESQKVLKKFKISKPAVGQSGSYQTGTIQSWSTSPKIAEEFAGLFSIAGRDDDSLGIVFEAIVPPDKIEVPIAFIPIELQKKYIRYQQDEILMQPGTYPVKVYKLIGDWESYANFSMTPFIKNMKEIFQHLIPGVVIEQVWNKTKDSFSLQLRNLKTIVRSKTNIWSPAIELRFNEPASINIYLFDGLESKDPGSKEMERMQKEINSDWTFQSSADKISYMVNKKEELIDRVMDVYKKLKIFYKK